MSKKKKKRYLSYVITVLVVACAIVGFCAYRSHKAKVQAAKVKKITCVKDLTGSKIGVQIGTTGDIYASDYEGDKQGTKVERYNKGTDAVQALKVGKIDSVIIDEQPAKAFVQKNDDLKILKENFALEQYAICVSKKNTALKDSINTALRELKSDGTIEKIIKNYMGKEEERGKFPYKAKDVSRDNGTLKVATNAEFPPYEYRDDDKVIGADMDIMQAICDKLGMKLQIEDMAFDSIITAVVSGKADVGAAGMTVTKDRLKNIDFTDTYTTAKQVIIVKNTSKLSKSSSFVSKLKDNFMTKGRYRYFLQGLGNTLIITFFAAILGVVLGCLIALIRASHDRNQSFPVLNFLCKIYLTVVRGTPSVVQLLIFFYIILVSIDNKIIVAVIAFGMNSAAYVAEIVRSGIMSVDPGQNEAARSLGLNYRQTMRYVVLPQAFKNVLPALGNEVIVLLKETAISGYIALVDLTKAGDIVRSVTYEAYIPLFSVALIYLVIVMIMSAGVNYLERRLRNNER